MDLQTRQAIASLVSQLTDIQDKVARVERAAGTPQLPNSSLTGGGIKAIDENGTHRGTVGFQNDGTFAVTYHNGDAPPTPTDPVVAAHQLALVIYWDGELADGSALPADFQRVDVHMSETPGFTPDGTTVVGSLLAEGALSVVGDNDPKYVKLVAVTHADVASAPTDEVSATPLPVDQITADALDGKTITGATIRTISNDGGFFAYAGDPTLGNLIVSIASMAGTDDFGNTYPEGLDVNQGAISGSQIVIEPGEGNGIFVYSAATTVTTFDSGSGTWVCPDGVTSVLVECWGAGGGAGDVGGSSTGGAGGGGGGEYAAETLTVTPGNSYPYVVGAGGASQTSGSAGDGSAGGSTTFNTTSVVAHGGSGGKGPTAGRSGGAGGTGSTNTTHFDGGAGGSGSSTNTDLGRSGGGGGGSGGTGSAGNNGGNGGSGVSGSGGAAVTGGGRGGDTPHVGEVKPTQPGGGAGGGNELYTPSTNGSPGRVTITYTPTRKLLASVAGAAGTDAYGNDYPSGVYGQVTTDQTTYLSDKVSNPTFGSATSYVSFTNAQWPYIEMACPPSEAITVALRTEGGNSASAASSLRFGVVVTDQTAGGETVISAATVRGTCHVNFGTTTGSPATAVSMLSFEQHVLGALGELAGRAGHTLRITPQYRLSSGTNSNVTCGTCRMTVEPLINATAFV